MIMPMEPFKNAFSYPNALRFRTGPNPRLT